MCCSGLRVTKTAGCMQLQCDGVFFSINFENTKFSGIWQWNIHTLNSGGEVDINTQIENSK